ncbi:sensor histidine kinase [Candidatus Magnetobacterium casense]|uniref:histidine kinase n=1 Tax=Candidatus Magnetobacterium casense TaxID=1455061 RepID=A0ABS6RYK5_9BACT|nr:hybrid sensor histidine kinase/response regulator [Candidatus Magnetobacterium casensis]MBV6341666.1 hybrid sensor histidine kinase/response regulator [Candidatus Magnetobacterium casensis]
MSENKYGVLIVDDEPGNRQLLRQILMEHYKLSFATDGVNALEVVVKVRPELVLLDIMMPHMDGYEVCRRLKANPATADIPVIFISALTDIAEKVNAFNSGGVDYVCKPFQREEVVARIQTHLNLYSLQKALERRVQEEVDRRRLDEQMLVQQSKMAAMGEMIGAIAHQWKQPLNALSLTIQDMEIAFDTGELDKQYIEQSVAQGMALIKHMSQTVSDFQNFLKPSHHKNTFSVAEAFYDVAALFSDQLKKDNVALRLNFPRTLELYSSGYINEFKQVILNLINNSRDAIKGHKKNENTAYEGWITVDIEGVDDKVVVRLCDNGGGIDPSVLNRLFEPYVTTKGDGGTGIGLYMSRAIVEGKMEGAISVSNTQVGVEFVITLPLTTGT